MYYKPNVEELPDFTNLSWRFAGAKKDKDGSIWIKIERSRQKNSQFMTFFRSLFGR